MTLQKALEYEKNELQKRILLLEGCLSETPSGQMRISHSNGCVQYYFRNVDSAQDQVSRSGYFYNNDANLAKAIAQRDYTKRLLKELKTRYKAIDKTLCTYNRTDPEKVFLSFSPDRQKLIEPYILSRTMYIKQWLEVEYTRKTFGENTPEIYTMNGERVRSKSEKIIADTLFRYNIPYRYEYPLNLNGFGLVHPDFLVMNPFTRKEYFWEHFGMMDNEQYLKDALKKIEAYEKNDIFPGLELIITSETRTMPLNIPILDKIVERYLL